MKQVTAFFCRILLLVFITVNCYGQLSCDKSKECGKLFCAGDYKAGIKCLEEFRKQFPADSLTDDVGFYLANYYIQQERTEEAKELLLSLLAIDSAKFLAGRYQCPRLFDEKGCLITTQVFEEVLVLKYQAAMLLYNMYTKEKKYDSALHILVKAGKEYYCTPYLPNDCRKLRLLKYADTYEKLGRYDEAILALAPFVMSEDINVRLIELLKKYKNIDHIKEIYKNIEDSLSIEEAEMYESEKYVFESDKDGRLLRTINTKEYGRKVYWHFLGQKFSVGSVNDYKSHRVKGERKKRKLDPVKSNEELIQEGRQEVEKSAIYRLLYN